MKILRGKFKGKNFTLHQACNDWFTVKEQGTKLFGIRNAEWTLDEAKLLKKQNLANRMGIMFKRFTFSWKNMRFHKRNYY